MKPLALTGSLRKAIQRCVWFESPEVAVSDPAKVAAYIFTYGSVEDVSALREQYDEEDIKAVLDAAPPGIYDPRSWAYWNLIVGRYTQPAMPTRRLG